MKSFKSYLLSHLTFACFLLLSFSSFGQDYDMKAELKKFARLDTFPDNYGFTNSRGLKLYHELLKNTQLEVQKHQIYYELIWQYMYAGYPDSSLLTIEKIPDDVWRNAKMTNPEYDKEFITALSYLRIGEQTNCQQFHNPYSCIFPLNEKAQHKIRAGSENAVQNFLKVLERSPDHYTAIWLMNIAYMTLGKYPSYVPKEYLIDFYKYPQDTTVPYFNNIADKLGVNTHTFYGGSIVEDFNNDGYLDIFATSGDLSTNVELYISDGKGGYQNKTSEADLIGITGGGNATHADFNNDGFMDIYIMRGGWLGPKIGKYHPNSLLQNNGNGTFTDVTKKVGLLSFYASQTACFADFNNDGWLDLFVGNEEGYSQLYQNDNGIFKDVSSKVGIYLSTFVKGSFWGDYDNDGYIDLYVSVSNGENYLFKNEGPNSSGQYSFINVADKAGVKYPLASFPTFFFDYNNDGWLDLFCASYPSDVARMAHQYITDTANIEFSCLYINQKDGTFKNQAKEANLNRSIEAMGINYGDIDNDGWLDFYVGTGYPSFEALMPNLMFRNDEGRCFLEVAKSGFGHLQKGHGISFADMDNDGDQDVYVSLGGFMEADMFWNILLENPGNANNWITLDLEGTISNKCAIGATITIIAESDEKDVRTIYRQISPGGSFGSSSLQEEIGLGKCTKIQSITIFWPASKTTQTFTNVDVNKKYQITEGKLKIKEVKLKQFKFLANGSMHHH